MSTTMRPKVALKLLLITVGASLVAYILTSATRPHAHTACTGPLCEDAVQKARDSDTRHIKQSPNLHVGLDADIRPTVAVGNEIAQASEDINTKNEGNEIGDGNWVNVEIGAFEKIDSENDIENRFEELDRIMDVNDPASQEQEEAEKTPVIESESDNAQSYLEKIGVIQKNKSPKTGEEQKDLYSWKIQNVVAKDKSSVVQAEDNNGQGLNGEGVRSEPNKGEANKNAEIPFEVAAPKVFSDNDNARKNSKTAGIDIPVRQNGSSGNIGLGGDKRDNVYVDEHNRIANANNLIPPNDVKNNTNRMLIAKNNAPDSLRDAEGKSGKIQGIIRGVSFSKVSSANNDNTKNSGYLSDLGKSPYTVKNYPRGNETAKQPDKSGLGENTGDLLRRAGVINSEKDQQPHKQDGIKEIDLDSLRENLKNIQEEPQSSEKGEVKHSICVEFLSGTGNILFQFASAYAIAKGRNMTLIIPEHIPKFSEAFDIVGGVDDTISFDLSRCKDAIDASNFKRGIYDETFLKRLPLDTDIKLKGYFQSFKYFEGYAEDVRDILTFKDDVTTKAMEAINVLHFRKFGKSLHHLQTEQAITLVGVHVQRYLVNGRQSIRPEEGYRIADQDYIQRAMAEMKNRYSGHENSAIRFYVVSDDDAWAVAQLGIRDLTDTMLVTGLSWSPTLALLANMDHVITTVGALGWWGAWLADGDVIYYQNFVEPGSKMDSAYLASDFFPSLWTHMV